MSLLNIKITGVTKLRRWKLKLPKEYNQELRLMTTIFDDLYRQRLDAGIDIDGRSFAPNALIVGRNRTGPIRLSQLKSDGPLMRSGRMKQGLTAKTESLSASISFSTSPYKFPHSATSVAKVAANHQAGYTVAAGEVVKISGYSNQPPVFSNTGLVKGLYFISRGFEVPERKHFGIPKDDVAIFTGVLHESVRASLQRHHGRTH